MGRFGAILCVAACGAGACAAVASAAATPVVSANWAGYAVVRHQTRFKQVTATWVEPRVACRAGHPSFSVFWVGLGGLADSSRALEQAGTEADCGAGGRAHHLAWYELLPAPPVAIRMPIRPGDVVTTTVTVRGRRVSVRLADHTRRRAVTRTLRMSSPDVSSAEWIAEAPSACDTRGTCSTLPLSDFGTVTFSRAGATTASGRARTISYPGWRVFAIQLSSSVASGPFVNANGPFAATPGPLSADGRAFSVGFSTQQASSARAAAAPRRFPATERAR